MQCGITGYGQTGAVQDPGAGMSPGQLEAGSRRRTGDTPTASGQAVAPTMFATVPGPTNLPLLPNSPSISSASEKPLEQMTQSELIAVIRQLTQAQGMSGVRGPEFGLRPFQAPTGSDFRRVLATGA